MIIKILSIRCFSNHRESRSDWSAIFSGEKQQTIFNHGEKKPLYKTLVSLIVCSVAWIMSQFLCYTYISGHMSGRPLLYLSNFLTNSCIKNISSIPFVQQNQNGPQRFSPQHGDLLASELLIDHRSQRSAALSSSHPHEARLEAVFFNVHTPAPLCLL